MAAEPYTRARHISNPLTIIAIFAGIAEVVSAVTLLQVSENVQLTLVWFVMLFPTLLAVMFFLTVNFNHRSLYAPSDYKDESMFRDLIGSRIQAKNEIESAQNAVEVARNSLTADIEERMSSLGPNVVQEIKNAIADQLEPIRSSLRVAERSIGGTEIPTDFRSGYKTRISRYLIDNPDSTSTDIAEAFGFSKDATRKFLRNMFDTGELKIKREGSTSYYSMNARS